MNLKFIPFSLSLTLIFFFTLQIQAQEKRNYPSNPIKLDTPLTTQEVEITTELTQNQKLENLNPTLLTTGKKAEIISFNSTGLNTVTNNSRQTFGQLAGVHIWENDGSGLQTGVAVRGLSPNRSWEFNVRQNGMDISSEVFGYPEAYYQPPFQALDHIEIIRGSSSLQFGPQMGGMLNYVLRNPSSKPFSLRTEQSIGTYGLINTFNEISGTYKKWSYLTYFHHRQANGWRENSKYNTSNFYALLGYQISPKTKATISFTSSYSLAQQAGGLTDSMFNANPQQSKRERNYMQIPWKLATFSLTHQLNPHGIISLQTTGIWGERASIGFVNAINVADNGSARQIDVDRYENYAAELRYKQSYTLLEHYHTLAVGARLYQGKTNRMQRGFELSPINTSFTTQGSPYGLDLNFTTLNRAIFLENSFSILEKWKLVTGIRWESVSNSGKGYTNLATNSTTGLFNSLNPNKSFFLAGLGIEYQYAKSGTLYANISQSYKPVQFADFTQNAANSIRIDTNLSPSLGTSHEIGIRGSIKKWFNYDITAYILLINNRIGTYDQLENNTTYQRRGNIGSSVNKGIEISLISKPIYLHPSKKLGSLTLNLNLALLDARYVKYEINNPSTTVIDLNGKWVENAPGVIQRISGVYNIGKLELSVSHNRVTESYATATNANFSTNGNSGNIPGYQVWDASINWQFTKSFYLSGSVNNFTNSRYFTRRSTGYPGPGLLPADGRTALITLGFKI